MDRNSPLSMALCFELVKRGANMTVREALETDYRLLQALQAFPDFFTGVHQLLVKKDRDTRPDWVHNSIDEISDTVISFFFEYPV